MRPFKNPPILPMPTESYELRHVLASAGGVDMLRRSLVVVTDIFKNKVHYEVNDGVKVEKHLSLLDAVEHWNSLWV